MRLPHPGLTTGAVSSIVIPLNGIRRMEIHGKQQQKEKN